MTVQAVKSFFFNNNNNKNFSGLVLEKVNIKKYWNAECCNHVTAVNFPEKNKTKHCSSEKVISINQHTHSE